TRRGGDTVEAGLLRVDEGGAYSGAIDLPEPLAAGPYTLALTGVRSGATAQVRLIISAGSWPGGGAMPGLRRRRASFPAPRRPRSSARSAARRGSAGGGPHSPGPGCRA